MIPRTFPSTYASNGQQQMLVHFLTDVTGLQRWSDYIPVKLAQTGTEDSYANNGYIDIAVLSPLTASTQAWKEYIPVYVDDEATDTWTVNATGYIPYGYALFGDASMQLDFTNGAALDSRITFTRSTTATRTNSSGLIESVAINGPRFDYNPVTLAPKGLLIEEQRTNLLTYSEQFDNGAWSKLRTTVTVNTVVSPDGTVDADKLVEDTSASNTHYLRVNPDFTFVANTAYTLTVYLKAGERTNAQVALNLFNTGNLFTTTRPAIDVNLQTGTINSVTAGVTNSSIVSVGNGWYRCSVSGLMGATGGTQATGVFILDDSYITAYTGNGYSGIYIWGAQLEAGAFATSYIPTTTAQVTRAADAASMTGANFSSWYNQSEGTVYADFVLGVTSSRVVAMLSDNTNNNLINMRYASNSQPHFQVISSGVTQADIFSTTAVVNTAYKRGVSYAANDFAQSINASTPGTDSAGSVPTISRLNIGATWDGFNVLNGHIRRIAYFPRRLSNSELTALTS